MIRPISKPHIVGRVEKIIMERLFIVKIQFFGQAAVLKNKRSFRSIDVLHDLSLYSPAREVLTLL